MNDSTENRASKATPYQVTAIIRDVECLYFHPLPGCETPHEPFMRIHATVVEDFSQRFDPGDWVLTSKVLSSETDDTKTDFITLGGSRYRTLGREYSCHHFYMTREVARLCLSGAGAQAIRTLCPNDYISVESLH